MSDNALLTFSVGPVHTFIAQARRVADLWTGSEVLSHLVRAALTAGCEAGAEPVFPEVDRQGLARGEPKGVPNRFVCRVSQAKAEAVARAMDEAVRREWRQLVVKAVDELSAHDHAPSPEVERQAEVVFDIAWSWVPEGEGYSLAAAEGARRWNELRTFRPFVQDPQGGEKCAVCGERTALPDGHRHRVRELWEQVEANAEAAGDHDEQRFFRFSQTRLCLVCATKRLFTKSGADRGASFSSFDRFQPDDERAYYALLAMDGDRMGQILNWSADRLRGEVEAFHRTLSRCLTDFAESLRSVRSWQLNTARLGIDQGPDAREGKSPQLIYAGGEDVLVVCDTRDAVTLARKIRERYREALEPVAEHLVDPEDFERFTLSGAILFAHSKYPAGSAFREVEDLLGRKAKEEAGRNALALRLVKRGGVPVEVAFRWKESEDDGGQAWVDELASLIERVQAGEMSSKQTYALRQGEGLLAQVLKDRHWAPWVQDRLRRNGATAEGAEAMARTIAPFLQHGRGAALRIVRFLAVEMGQGSVRAGGAS